MIKALLKKLFPRVFLKKAFLVYNTVKARTWDALFFRREVIFDNSFLVKEEKNPFLELQINTSSFSSSVANKFSPWTNPGWKQDQYLLVYNKPGFIEPKVGWGMTLKKNLLYPSIGFSSAPHVHKPDFVETYFKMPRVTLVEKVISLRDTGEENYFHFFNDVLPKLFFLETKGVDLQKYTIIVSSSLYAKQYFQWFLRSSRFKNLKWYVQQPGEWIRFSEAIFCKPYTHTREYFVKALETLNYSKDAGAERRLFLTRSTQSLRYIENLSDLEPVLEKYNFEVVDTSLLNPEAQAELFRDCRYLVAIHGAGITNIIFRNDNPLSILEIVNPGEYIPFHYAMLSRLFRFDYVAMEGTRGKEAGRGGFIIQSRDLESELVKLIST